MTRLGLVVNPVAGAGGPIGLHGSDDITGASATEATTSSARARRALSRLAGEAAGFDILAAPGVMGADLCRGLGLEFTEVGGGGPGPGTTAEDTARAVTAMVAAGVDLVLFAGGDGTARDVLAVTGSTTPVLGIPSGVKMRSGVFALSPEAAGAVAAGFLLREPRTVPADVVDVDEDDSGGAASRHFGVARVPAAGPRIQRAKSGARPDDDAELAALCRGIAASLDPTTLYLYGPGSTTKRILAELGLPGTALGIDATLGRDPVGADLSEAQLLDLLESAGSCALFLGVLGGQGFLLGRGNQQLSPAVLDRVGEARVVILASRSKMAMLSPAVLWMDSGDERAERVLPSGYRRVLTGPGREMVMKVAHAGDEKEFARAV